MAERFGLDDVRARQSAARDAAAAELDGSDLTHLTAQAIVDCDTCDDDGYRGATVCDHVEHSTPEGRAAAMALIRAALAKGDTR